MPLLDIVKKGSVDRSLTLRMADSTDGTPETAVVAATAGLDVWYKREGGLKVSLTESNLAALDSAHSDGGLLHISDGEYRVDFTDAAFATGANYVDVGWGATGMVGFGGRVRLVNFDLEDTVRLGLTALPNAAAEAAGGLYTRGTGAGQINQPANGQIDGNVVAMAANVVTAAAVADGAIDRATFAADTGLQSVRSNTAQAGGATSITLDASASATNDFYKHCLIYLTGGTSTGQFRLCTAYNGTTKVATVAPAWTTNPDATSTFAVLPAGIVDVEALGADATSLADLKDFADAGYDPATNKVQGVVLVDTLTTYTGDTPQTGDAFARLGAPAGVSIAADIAVIEGQTDDIGAAGAGLTDLGGFSTTAKAQIQTEAEDALVSHHVVLVKTTIATLASQTSFTLTAGSADNDAYNGSEIVIEDSATAAQKAVGVVSDYTGATKTVTLLNDPAVFTMAVGDVVTIRPSRALKATVDNRTLDVTATGAAGVDWGNVENKTTTNDLSGTTISTSQVVASVSGAVGSITGVTFPTNFAALGINASGHVILQDASLVTAKLGTFALAKTTNITGFNDLSAAQVNAEVVDVLTVDTFAQPGQEAPAATTTLGKMLAYLYKFLRNKKTQTATEFKVFADDTTTVDQKATVADDATTFTSGEIGTGP